MQFFSPRAVLAAIPPGGVTQFFRDSWQAASHDIGAAKLLGFLLLLQLISIVGYWVASMIFAPGRATFRNAVGTWLNMLGVGIAAAVALVAVVAVVLNKGQGNVLAWLAVPAVLLLVVAVALAVPSKMYQIGALRSFGLLVVQAAIAGVAGAVLQFAVLGSKPKLPSDWLAHFQAPKQQPSPEETEVLRRGLGERVQVLNRRYEQLEIRSRHLPPNDSAALSEYQRDKAAYDRDLEDLKAAASVLPK